MEKLWSVIILILLVDFQSLTKNQSVISYKSFRTKPFKIRFSSMGDRNPIILQYPSPPIPPPTPPAPLYTSRKLPYQDLLADNRRRDFIDICVPLCQASIKGNWKVAKHILRDNKNMVRYGITEKFETALHVAASTESTSFMVDLMKMMTKEDLELQTKNGDTALCLVAAAGNVKMARLLVTKNEKLLRIQGREGLFPLCVAARYGKRNMVKYLYYKCEKMKGTEWKATTKHWLFLKCIELDLFDIAWELFKDHEQLSDDSESVLKLLSRKPSAFSEPKSHFFNRITSTIYLKAKVVAKESEARQLLRMIWANILKRPKVEVDKILKGPQTSINGRFTYSSPILFVATEMGNTEFVVELIRQYPDLIWNKNKNNQSLFHIAVYHRHESIYNLLHEIGSMKDLITRLIDTKRNNMLHLVGLNCEKNQSQKVSGVAFQMQRELLWFKEVESMIPPYYREERNIYDQTPRELFTENHKDLVSEGEKWMKETASQCMVVATLITTVVFAVAFTFPGGYNQNSGFPMFLENGTFIAFVILNAISLILSSTSILVFLSILTSRYAEEDFLESLPRKLLIGLATLFLSIISMMVAFSVSFFVLYHEKFITVPICISIIAVIPIIAFAFLHHRLLMDVFKSTNSSRSLFKPKNQLFCYQNPRV